jgi:hypothetical protein
MRRALAIVALPVALALSLVGCDNPDPVASPAAVETPTTPAAPTPTQTATEPTESTEPPAPVPTLDYGMDGVEIVEPGDVALLEGAPEDFKAFVARQARQAAKDAEECPGAFHGLTVSRLIGDYAVGSVNACGGYSAIWSKGDAGWAELLGTQEAWSCADLAADGVPDGLVAQCS